MRSRWKCHRGGIARRGRIRVGDENMDEAECFGHILCTDDVVYDMMVVVVV